MMMLPIIFLGLCAFSTALGAADLSTVDVGTAISGELESESLPEGGLAAAMADNSRVTVGLVIENWTKWPLKDPQVALRAGEVTINPVTVMPGYKEIMVARKKPAGWKGTYGTVSWEVEGLNRRVVVMWSAPYDFNLHSNWLGVGLTKAGAALPSSKDAFNTMYYYSSNSQLGFNRKEYYDYSGPVEYTDDTIRVEGEMTTGHDAMIKIRVLPRKADGLAWQS